MASGWGSCRAGPRRWKTASFVGAAFPKGPIRPAASAAPRYCGLVQGNWGKSTVFKKPVTEVLGRGLGQTGWLMLAVMLVMVPTSLLLGVLSGMREGSRTDRILSTFAIATTATPEYVSGVIFIALFA